jgi:Co/Zn/Cd efflux system component
MWEVEKGSEVASAHVVVKKGWDSNIVQEKIQKIVGTKEWTIQLVYLDC